MKVAVIGLRSIFATDIGTYISDGDEIVSGGGGRRRFLRGGICEKEWVKAYSLFTSI